VSSGSPPGTGWLTPLPAKISSVDAAMGLAPFVLAKDFRRGPAGWQQDSSNDRGSISSKNRARPDGRGAGEGRICMRELERVAANMGRIQGINKCMRTR